MFKVEADTLYRQRGPSQKAREPEAVRGGVASFHGLGCFT